MPRNLDEHKFEIPAKTIKPISAEDFKKMLDASMGTHLELFLLLFLNCGMRSTDAGELLDSEVDWEEGRITRQRSKTRIHHSKDVPCVSYHLWDRTFDLLKKYRSGDEVALKTPRGQPWAWESMDASGVYHGSDNVAIRYNRLAKRLKIDSPLSSIRKRGATVLDSHEHYGRFANHYLGESPRSIKDRHYAAPSIELFDSVIKWLGERHNMNTER
jgi:integrase